MNNRNYGLYAVALAIGVVGALWLGLPVGALGVLAIVLVCPLMMFFMMRGMHGGDQHDGDQHDTHGVDPYRQAKPHDHTTKR
jgi:hypothetical protein